MSNNAPIALGVIGRPRGLGGDVFVTLYNQDSDQLVSGRRFVLIRDGEEPLERTMLSCKPAGKKNRYVTRWEGVKGRADAESLVGLVVHIERSELEEIEEDEFYYDDVLGYTVEEADGTTLGTVYRVFSAATDILIVRGEGTEWMIPAVQDVIVSLNHDEQKFVVAIPDGLEPSKKR